MKLVFLSDLHATACLTPPQVSLLAWVTEQIRQIQAHVEVFGGDLLQESKAEALDALMPHVEGSRSSAQRLWLPGNRDVEIGRLLKDPAQRLGTHRLLSDERVQVLLLDTESEERTLAGMEASRKAFAPSKLTLVASHRQPDSLPPAVVRRMADLAALLKPMPTWISGNIHKHREIIFAGWRCVSTPGLDAARTIAARPEFLVVEPGGNDWRITRVEAPEHVLRPAVKRRIRLGIAALAPLADLFDKARKHHIGAIQISSSLLNGSVSSELQAPLNAWREQTHDAYLSIHLPTVDPSRENMRAKLEPLLTWGTRLGVQDYTLHLPDRWKDHQFFSPGGGLAGPLAEQALQSYADFAERVLDSGAQLSLENIHNNADQVRTGDADFLSTRPWHLRKFVQMLREKLEKRVRCPAQTRRVGVIFDVGHARNNGVVSRELAPLNWIPELGDLIQTLHVHQVRLTEKGMKNHCVIDSLEGPLINYDGIMACMASVPGPDCCAFVEVRGLDDAIQSYFTLRRLPLFDEAR